MRVKQSIPISLDSFQINPKLMYAPIMLKDFMEQYQENRMTMTKLENPKSKFWKFINSFLVDTLIFIAAILTIFLVLVIIYILTGQSKLKALITTMALQRIRAVETLNTDGPIQNCNSGLLKVLMVLNLVIVVSLLQRKIKKSIFFQGHGENKTIPGQHKVLCLTKLESISQEYAFIQINGWTITKQYYPKEKFDMRLLEVKQGNTCITLNDKEIHLPTTLLIPLIHKLKVRKLFDKINLMHIYIMLKQRKSWYNLECEWG